MPSQTRCFVRFASVLSLFTLCLIALAVPARAATSPRTIPDEILIKFRPGARGSDRAAARASVNADLLRKFDFIGVEHLKIHGTTVDAAIGKLAHNPNVVYAEPNYEIRADVVPNDPRFNEMYGLRNTGQTGGTSGDDIRAVLAWDQFTGDPNIKVGVIDTGVDYNHPDLAANVWTNPGEIPGNSVDDDHNGYVDDVHGYDFSNSDGDPFDDNGHGTHTSGTIAAVGNNNVGVVGVNWSAKIVAIKFLSAAGSGSTAGAIAGVQYAIAVGVRLTSNSWGGGGFSQALLDAINAAGAAGQLFVAAAGNASQNTDTTPSYPASYNSPYIISVAATDHNDNLASFSNYGATTVDLGAPGVNILSTLPGNSYGLLSGTSMATPHVSGVVALAMGRFPGVPALQIKTLLLNAVDPRASLAGKCLTGGRLNAFMTIAEPDSIAPGSIADLGTSDPGSNTMRLAWTATGDDGSTGRATRYEIRYSTAPITEANFGSATLAPGSPDPRPAGNLETFEVTALSFGTSYYFAVKAFDEFNNAGGLSNVAPGTTLGAPDISASPLSFTSELLTGASENQTVTLRNDAEGTLDFTIPTPELQFTQPIIFPYEPYAKNEGDTRVGPIAQGVGGPDAFGYRWADSDQPGGPAFSWVDITGVGTQLSLSGDDAISAPLSLGISFPFYGGSFTSARIHTNGYLSFTNTAATNTYENQGLPNASAPENLVAPMWDDLDFGSTNRVYTYNDGTRFIVSWIGVPAYAPSGTPPGGPYTFQAILYPTGEIRYQYLNLAPPTNSATVGIQNGTQSIGLTVVYNNTYLKNNLAVRIVPLQQWLTVSPASGRILAGQSMNLQVRFNALGLNGGNFSGAVRVLSNDPDEGDVSLPASLHVIGAPDIAASPASLDFGSVFVGASPTKTVVVSNPGTDDLVVSGITSSDPTVTASPTTFTLSPLSSQAVTVTFHPTAPATLNATVTIASNDPDNPALPISVVGAGVPAPSFSVSPTSITENLLTNTATARTLRITNSGGSNYVFTAEALVENATGTATQHSDADNVPLDKDQADVQSGPAPLKAGGPDVFGYTYQDSDEPGGPAFSWVDISSTGTAIPFNSDDQTLGPFPVGFNFPFYGSTVTSFKLCTNGWLSFSTTTLTTFTNTALPNTGSTVPPAMLAAFWDDLDYRPTLAPNARAYYLYDGTKLIVQFKAVPRRSESGTTATNDFEILLFPNGTIVYQYLTMNAVTKNSATIGEQNAARNDGLQVAFNASYVKNNLAVRFRPPARFLTVTPTSGTVAPGAFTELSVGLNAADLFGGTYEGAVRISGNDPVLPQQDVSVTLNVTGVPDIAASPATIDFGNVFLGFPGIRELVIQNRGTDVLNVTDIASTDPNYGVDHPAFSVPPQGFASLFVSFNPDPGSHPATLVISSNDPDSPTFSVPLSGAGVIPPDVSTSPAAVTSTLPIPGTETQTLTIHNDGGSNLDFVVGTNLTAQAVPQYEELALGKDDADPRQGLLGNGGPDVFGYTWRDSDDPDGPAFDWVDITGIGTPLTFNSGDDAIVTGIPIGFSFPFYGGTFNTVNANTNGWLSFTSTLANGSGAYTNQPLPNSGAPENLLAAFWDDLNPGTAVQRVYTYRDGTRFIISYVGVPRLTSGGPYTFQVVLYPSGRIVYQYLDMQGTRLNEATVGIQNAARNDGLTVAFDNNYVHNNLAVEFRTTPDWLLASPTSGTIPAGGSMPLTLTLNTEGLFGGTHAGSLRISSNDPDEGVVNVPATLNAVGVPHLAANPTGLTFGTIYVSQHAERTVELRNSGSDVVQITGLALTHPSYQLVSPPSLPITLGERGAVTLTVRFQPADACAPPSPCQGELVVTSNDPDGSAHVSLTGFALIPPEAVPDPSSLRAALATSLGPTALTRTKTLQLKNEGGSDLTWTAQGLMHLPVSFDTTPSAEQGKDDPGQPGGVTTASFGGPDAAGYRWADSDDPVQGTPFAWIDITGVGTQIPFTGDDQNMGPYPLPFPFTYYGNTFTSFRACTNGWISFTSDKTTFTNTGLPNAATSTPENLIAPFWDDLTFSSAGDVYTYYDGSKFIISYVNVPRLGSGGGPYTFQILLYPSGTIDFQYLTMAGTRLNEATIGVQNQNRDIGLQVVFNASYVKDNLRVRFSQIPGWLAVTPNGGIIPAGGRADLAVAFSAAGLADGDTDGAVRIESNDLTDPVIDVPAHLHVGVAVADFDLDPNSISRASNGNWVSGYVEPPSGEDAHAIRASSVLLQRAVPVATGAPVAFGDKDADGLTEAAYKFNRVPLLSLLPDGNDVEVEAIAEVEDVTWIRGLDHVRVLRPRVIAAAGLEKEPTKEDETIAFAPGDRYELQWSDPDGYTPLSYDIWVTTDGGSTWAPVTTSFQGHSYSWTVPSTPTSEGQLEIDAIDGDGIMGSWLSPVFTIESVVTAVEDDAATLPKSFGMRLAGANPTNDGQAKLELSVPSSAPVQVRIYDVRGALVRSLVDRTLTPGRHPVHWDGRTAAGTPVGSGVYFVQMLAAGKTYGTRLSVVH